MPIIRTKSLPVPAGITPSTASAPISPLATSLTVPSPPMATIRVKPASTPILATSTASSGSLV